MILALSQTLFRRRLASAIALPITLLLVLCFIFLWQITGLLSALRSVDRTNQIISQANYTQKLLLDTETAVRGYVLTGRQKFLNPYEQANARIDSSLNELRRLISANPSQVQRVTELIAQSKKWKQQIPPAITRTQRGEPQPPSYFENQKQSMDIMRQEITTLITTSEELRNQSSRAAQKTAQGVILSSLFLTLSVGTILAYFIRRQILGVSQMYENALHTAQAQTKETRQTLMALQYELTQRQQVEVTLRNQEQLFRSTFNQAAVGIAHVGLNGQWLRVNQKLCEIVGYTREELLQGSFQDITYPDDLDLDLHYVRRVLANEISTYSIEKRYVRKDGSLVWINLTVSLMYEADRQPKHFISVVEDISARKQAESELQQLNTTLEQRVAERTAQLEETNRELEAFTYSVSHDLRAPLRTIQGFAQAFLEDCGDQFDEVCKSYINSIIDDAVHMNGLINDLLAYSRLTRTQIKLQPTALNEVVQEALKQLTAQIQEKQAQIRIADIHSKIMIAHRSTLIQIIANLISNAVKFVEPHIQPQIDIFVTAECQDNRDWLKLWVIDNGIGIAPEHQDRIFRVFERLHGVETYPGTGIGLAIVRKGLDRMDGQVGVESQLGRGSRFWIALPSAVVL